MKKKNLFVNDIRGIMRKCEYGLGFRNPRKMVLRKVLIFRKCMLNSLGMTCQGLYDFANHIHILTHEGIGKQI